MRGFPDRICLSPPGGGRISRRSTSPPPVYAATAHGVTVDARLRSSNRRVFAIGDASGGPQFTHLALYHAGIVLRNALFRLPARVDYRALPWVTYTDPELAQAGMSEMTARDAYGDKIRVLRWDFSENDRAHTERDTAGRIKIVTKPNGRILGAAILGAGAGDQIMAWALAISRRLKIGDDGQPHRALSDARRSRQARRRKLLYPDIVRPAH